MDTRLRPHGLREAWPKLSQVQCLYHYPHCVISNLAWLFGIYHKHILTLQNVGGGSCPYHSTLPHPLPASAFPQRYVWERHKNNRTKPNQSFWQVRIGEEKGVGEVEEEMHRTLWLNDFEYNLRSRVWYESQPLTSITSLLWPFIHGRPLWDHLNVARDSRSLTRTLRKCL